MDDTKSIAAEDYGASHSIRAMKVALVIREDDEKGKEMTGSYAEMSNRLDST